MDDLSPKLTRNERDMLIMLNTKVDQLGLDIKDIRDNIILRITRLETWKDSVDLYHARIDLNRFAVLANWVEQIKANYKFLVALLVLFGGLAGGLIGHILDTWFPILK